MISRTPIFDEVAALYPEIHIEVREDIEQFAFIGGIARTVVTLSETLFRWADDPRPGTQDDYALDA